MSGSTPSSAPSSPGAAGTPRVRPARPDEAEALTALVLRSKAHWGYDEAFTAACRDEHAVAAVGRVPSGSVPGRTLPLMAVEIGGQALRATPP